jgi:hypothetical protein
LFPAGSDWPQKIRRTREEERSTLMGERIDRPFALRLNTVAAELSGDSA